ncbi:MAG TPA: sigma-70 family RNA polymerase sigma factor [Tepidiformaceae bacterium]|nr:sigma-70 family RNA polymerase sigma factor [Tepidiformaceae bacterium]
MRDTEVETDGPPAEGSQHAEALARRAVAREAAAWEELFELHYRSVFAFVRYRLRSAEEAEDIASQVFEVAYANAARFNYQGVPIEGWLIGIARNLCRDYIKKLGRRGIDDEFDDSLELSAPDDTAAIGLRRDLLEAMQELTGDQKEVLQLRFLLDKSVAETAMLMQRSEDAVKNLQRRALAAMQRALGGAGYTEGGGG